MGALQLQDTVLQWQDRGGQRHIVRRHGPAQLYLESCATGLGAVQEFVCRDGNGEPGIVAREQQQHRIAHAGQRRLPDDLAVRRFDKERRRSRIGPPMPMDRSIRPP